ncbi:MAG: hypothetical protein AAF242_16450, partial [Bacteroidota bacterium]
MNNWTKALVMAFILVSLLSISGFSQLTCNCTDYVYVNDVDLNVTHKFEIDPTTGGVTEIKTTTGGVWLDTSVVFDQHGAAQDINGNIYIADGFRDDAINRINALGMVIDNDLFTPTGNTITTNFFIDGVTMYAFEEDGDIAAWDVCNGTKIGEMNVAGSYPSGAGAWGLYDHDDGFWYLASRSDPPAIYRGSLDISLYPSGTNNGTFLFQPAIAVTGDGGGDRNVMGLTRDVDGNYYIIENQTGAGSHPDAVLAKYSPAGVFIKSINAGTDLTPNTDISGDPVNGQPGWSGARGIAYSTASNKIYVGSRNNCVTVFDTALVEIDTLNIGIPLGGSPKAINILTECCPGSTPITIDNSICYSNGDPDVTVFLQDLLECQGIIAEGEWTPEPSNPVDGRRAGVWRRRSGRTSGASRD